MALLTENARQFAGPLREKVDRRSETLQSAKSPDPYSAPRLAEEFKQSTLAKGQASQRVPAKSWAHSTVTHPEIAREWDPIRQKEPAREVHERARGSHSTEQLRPDVSLSESERTGSALMAAAPTSSPKLRQLAKRQSMIPIRRV
jgi:hypothetical protein